MEHGKPLFLHMEVGRIEMWVEEASKSAKLYVTRVSCLLTGLCLLGCLPARAPARESKQARLLVIESGPWNVEWAGRVLTTNPFD